MNHFSLKSVFVVVCLSCLGKAAAQDKPVNFTRDIQPILARNCFPCHGPDKSHREAELRLDQPSKTNRIKSIVPGKPKESPLVQRVLSQDADTRMPPPDADLQLTDTEKQLLRRWVASGAKYEQHWAFVPPTRPDLPKLDEFNDWPKNDIDTFVLARMLEHGLQPNLEADRYTLVRRVYLDLIGLPPTPKEADTFVNDKSPQAFENLVDRLLRSKYYGERWARVWLDLARYSDTNGYEKDRGRSIWPFRDWVIKALNADMPFDQFTVEQLAGDMLPDSTNSQRVATGFHRNTMINEEGGIDPLEYRFYAMVDRVATTGTVWLGMTTGCAQCHSHKYDPISHTEYYGLMALMNNADEPELEVRDAAILDQRNRIGMKLAELYKNLAQKFPPDKGEGNTQARRARHLTTKFKAWQAKQKKFATDWKTLKPSSLKTNLPHLELLEDGSIFSSGDITKRDVFTMRFPLKGVAQPITALRIEVLPDKRLPAGGPGRAYYEGRKGDFFLSEVEATIGDAPVKFATASHSYGKITIGSGNANATNVIDGEGSTGWSTSGHEGRSNQLVLNLAEPLKTDSELQLEFTFERHFAASLGRFRLSATTSTTQPKASRLPVDVERFLIRSWGTDERARLMGYFLSTTPLLAKARKEISALEKQLPALPKTMVLQERPTSNPRDTHRHHRGEYLSPREPVSAGLPAVLLTNTPEHERPRDRLELARWLASSHNPLGARVMVNRFWRAICGAGLMRTSGDFGTQSDPPTHPKLLDWLATEFIKRGWSMKQMHRLIVTSATYRQSSNSPLEDWTKDPENQWLARGARFRIDAETVRDVMLKSSGLLSAKMMGPSVFPPQPASVTGLAYGNSRWNMSKGEDRYRRSLYTYNKRTSPFAAYTVFDGPTGEICVARRNRSNTPLQALTLLNDEMFFELAQAAALDSAKNRQQASFEQRATYLFRRFLTRPPSQDELQAITAFQQQQKARLESGQLDAAQILRTKKKDVGDPDTAAWTMLARSLMNLDETITKQ
ncbi:MAG: hypothetical protein CMJ78_12595 [Planctomycetaceae bacterium]|nr:hypothetical protein [Planctomycetaceae bacterium]